MLPFFSPDRNSVLNSRCRSSFVIFLVELLNTTGSIHNFLRSGVKRMAFRADLNVQCWFANGGLGFESIATAAGHGDFVVLWVNVGFHIGFPNISNWCGKVVRTHKGANYPRMADFSQAPSLTLFPGRGWLYCGTRAQ